MANRCAAVIAFAIALPIAASEYVADSACKTCHPSKYASYQGVGMAQSMRRPRADVLIEDFKNAHFVNHGIQYEMSWKDSALVFRRYQLDDAGNRINEIEQKVDWILGSGHRSRVYLYRTPSGELFQLPIAWYTQEKAWGMAPGFDRADNDGITRLVRRECLFCHNAYPDVPPGSDMHAMPQVFPANLPEGTGCQRCHGPGGSHVSIAQSGASDSEVRAAIVNPAKLARPLRDSVCAQCHLQPAVAMIGPRRFERGDYSFRPGELLDDYMLHVDIDEANLHPDQRFEINHHFYRLSQSKCFIKDGITCISCHDPHQPLAKDPRLAGVTSVCLGCHKRHNDSNECVSCHMPQRRTQDVVHVVMTDHKIQRRPPPGDLRAPLAEREPEITDVRLLHSDKLAGVYRDVAILRALPMTRAAADDLAKRSAPAASYDLINAYLQQRRYKEALAVIGDDLNARLREWRGIAYLGIGRKEAALADLQAAANAEPNAPDFQFNLGAVLHQLHRDDEALAALTRAVELRPNFAAAWLARAQTLLALRRDDEAKIDQQRARAIALPHSR